MKRQFLLIISLIFSLNAFSQITEIDSIGSESIWELRYELFDSLFRTTVPTGILEQDAGHLISFDTYNGTVDTNFIPCPSWAVKLLYYQLTECTVDTNALPLDYEDTYDDRIDSFLFADLIPISLIDYTINHFEADEVDDSLILYDASTESFEFNPLRSQSEWPEKDIIAASCGNDIYDSIGTISFIFPEEFFFTNKNDSLFTYTVDFEDGNGPVGLTFDSIYAISYTTKGLKEIEIKIDEGESDLFTRCALTIRHDLTEWNAAEEADEVFTLNTSYNGKNISGKVSIEYACGNATGELIKPFIMVDGFNPKELNFDFTYPDLIDRLPDDIRLEFFDKGYDLVFLDFDNGTGDLKEQAALLEALIGVVNTRKKNNFNTTTAPEKNVLIGFSSGSVIGRIALKRMEDRSEDHDVRVFYTFDGGHLGNNIPISIQYLAKQLINYPVKKKKGKQVYLKDVVKQVGQVEKVLTSPQAKQLFFYNAFEANPENPTSRTTFQDYLGTLGWPSNCSNVALLNGSTIGKAQDLTPGGTLMSMSLSAKDDFLAILPIMPWLKAIIIEFEIDVHANVNCYSPLDNSTSDQFFYRGLFWGEALGGLINVKSSHWAVKGKNMRSYDSAPGGSFPLGAGEQIQNSSIAQSLINNSKLVLADEFCMAPSVGALDIIPSSQTSLLYGNIENQNVITNSKSPYDYYYSKLDDQQQRVGKYNDQHVDFGPYVEEAMEDFLFDNELTDLSSPLDNDDYNFGRNLSNYQLSTKHFLTSSLDVQNGGNLSINGSSTIGYSGDRTDLPETDNFIVAFNSLNKCDNQLNAVELKIKNGSSLVLGDATSSRSGILHIQEGSKLILETGSVLNLYNESRIIVDEDAELRIEPGVTINLVDQNTFIKVSGKLRLELNTTLTYSGLGYLFLDFSESAFNGFDCAGNNFFDLYNILAYKRLEVGSGTLVEIPEEMEFRSISSKIELRNGAEIAIYSEATLINNVFTGVGWGGIKSFDQSDFIFHSNVVEGASIGLEAVETPGNNSPLKILNCEFRDNDIGIHKVGGSIDIRGTEFINNTDGGLQVDGAESDNYITNCKFNDLSSSAYNLTFEGSAGASSLNVQSSEFNDNQYALDLINDDTRIECSEIKDNTGVNGAIIVTGGSLDLSSSAFNEITNNALSIYLNVAQDFLVFEGENDFTNTKTNGNVFDGYLLEDATLEYESFNGNDSEWFINGDLNNWTGNTQTGPDYRAFDPNTLQSPIGSEDNIAYEDIFGDPIQDPVYAYCYDCALQYAVCTGNTSPIISIPAVLQGSSSAYSVINTATYSNEKLNDAIVDALGYISTPDTVYDDQTAFDRLHEVLHASIATPTDTDELAMNEAYEHYLIALGNSYENGQNTFALGYDTVPKSISIQRADMTFDSLLNVIDPNDSSAYQDEFNLRFDKAMVYRTAEHFSFAIDELDSLFNHAQNEDYDLTEHWYCVCNVENDYYDSLITKTEYLDLLDSCDLEFPISRRSRFFRSRSKGNPSFFNIPKETSKIIPNPSNGEAIIQAETGNFIMSVDIYTFDGRLVRTVGSVQKGWYKMPYLDQGKYYVRVIMENGRKDSRVYIVN